MKNKLIWHQVVLIVVLALLSGLKIATGKFGLDISLLWWWLGAVIGFLFVFSDRIFYVLISRGDEPLSVALKRNFEKGKLAEFASMLVNERHEQKELVMRSVLFVGAWAILALFTFTSTANFFARGFILGIGIHVVFDLLSDYFLDKQRLELWFWQIKRHLPDSEKKVFVGVTTLVFLWLALMF